MLTSDRYHKYNIAIIESFGCKILSAQSVIIVCGRLHCQRSVKCRYTQHRMVSEMNMRTHVNAKQDWAGVDEKRGTNRRISQR
jgi:hypothetical protein